MSAGEILWDVIDGVETLGGAPLNFSAHAQSLGHEVHLISAVGADARGREAVRIASAQGIRMSFVRAVPRQPTGTASVALNERGEPRFAIHHPAAYDFIDITDAGLERLRRLAPAWIYFGTLFQMSAMAREALRRLLEAIPEAIPFYDLNLRPESYTPELVADLLGRARVVKLNEEEAGVVEGIVGTQRGSLEDFCRGYAERYGWYAVCVTRGAAGCACLVENEYVEAPGCPVTVVDTVGAGDAFAAAFVHGFSNQWPAARIAEFANQVGAQVAGRRGAMPEMPIEGDRK